MKVDKSKTTVNASLEIPDASRESFDQRGVSLGLSGPYRERIQILGPNPVGQHVRTVHELDLATGLTKLVESTDPDFDSRIVMVEPSLLPWWTLRLRHPSPDESELHVLRVGLSGAERGKPQEESIWFWSVPTSVITLKIIEIAAYRIKDEMDRMQSNPARIAALSFITGEADLFENAGQNALELQEPILLHYLHELRGFFERHLETMLNEFLRQSASEADIFARSSLPTASASPTLADFQAEQESRIRERHRRRPGRPPDASAFADRLAFLEAVFQAVFAVLDKGDSVTQSNVSPRLFKYDGGRELRKQLRRHGFNWAAVRAGAMAAHASVLFPRLRPDNY
ncbi:MAG: hypothetical protein IPF82_11675 [Blastocatellia bacterium]|nr:hypothetical protein [Blastocatellia bacterium]